MKRFHSISLVLVLFGFVGAGLYWRAHRYDAPAHIVPITGDTKVAYFAGGCFWCTENDFEKLLGVRETISGYAGGNTTDPTYTSVSSHTTGHLETVEVRYDPRVIDYTSLVRYFFAHIDPTDPDGQFADQGDSYTSAVFYQTADERLAVLTEIARLTESRVYPKPLVTTVRPFEIFFPAEEYHQNYGKKNPVRYQYYRSGSGRDQYLAKTCEWRKQKHISCEVIPEH